MAAYTGAGTEADATGDQVMAEAPSPDSLPYRAELESAGLLQIGWAVQPA